MRYLYETGRTRTHGAYLTLSKESALGLHHGFFLNNASLRHQILH
jgi:hypothetical protein